MNSLVAYVLIGCLVSAPVIGDRCTEVQEFKTLAGCTGMATELNMYIQPFGENYTYSCDEK